MGKNERIKTILATLGTTLAVELVMMLLLTGTGVLSVGSGNIRTSGNAPRLEQAYQANEGEDLTVGEETGEDTGEETVEDTDDQTSDATTATTAGTSSKSAKTSSKTTRASSKTTSSTKKTTTTTKKTTTTTTKNNTGDNDGDFIDGWF